VAHSSVRWLKARDNMKPKPFLDDFRQNATKTRQGVLFPDNRPVVWRGAKGPEKAGTVNANLPRID
jgi:hypothetical protein